MKKAHWVASASPLSAPSQSPASARPPSDSRESPFRSACNGRPRRALTIPVCSTHTVSCFSLPPRCSWQLLQGREFSTFWRAALLVAAVKESFLPSAPLLVDSSMSWPLRSASPRFLLLPLWHFTPSSTQVPRILFGSASG